MHEHEMQRLRHGQLDEVHLLERANEDDPADETRNDVVGMSSRNLRFGGQGGADQLIGCERAAEQRVYSNGSGNGRSGATALAAGEGKTLLTAETDAHIRSAADAKDFRCGDTGGMARRVAREVGMTGPVDANAGMLLIAHGPDAIGEPGAGDTEN